MGTAMSSIQRGNFYHMILSKTTETIVLSIKSSWAGLHTAVDAAAAVLRCGSSKGCPAQRHIFQPCSPGLLPCSMFASSWSLGSPCANTYRRD